jgi:hypothetical protein
MTGTEATRTLELEHALEQAEQRLRLALGDRLCDLMREKHYHRSYQVISATRLRNAVDRAVDVILAAKDGAE